MGGVSDAPRGTVLVVDDEPTIVEVVGRYMERAGYETHSAGDGPEALRLAGPHRPDRGATCSSIAPPTSSCST